MLCKLSHVLKIYIYIYIKDLAYIDIHYQKLKSSNFIFLYFSFLCILGNQIWVKYPEFKTQLIMLLARWHAQGNSFSHKTPSPRRVCNW